MGFLKGKAFGKCIVCKKFTPILFRNEIAEEDKYICNDCLANHVEGSKEDLVNWASTKTEAEILRIFNDNSQKIDARSGRTKQLQKQQKEYLDIKSTFTNNNTVKFGRYYFDPVQKQILMDATLLDRRYKVFPFASIVSYQPIQDGHNEHRHHGVTRAIVGGTIAGGAGAIVGAVTGGKDFDYIDRLGVSINFKDGTTIQLMMINSQEKKNGIVAKTAYKNFYNICGILDSQINHNSSSTPNNSSESKTTDVADEIYKFKKLLDNGAITQEEFEAKKKQLLNL